MKLVYIYISQGFFMVNYMLLLAASVVQLNIEILAKNEQLAKILYPT